MGAVKLLVLEQNEIKTTQTTKDMWHEHTHTQSIRLHRMHNNMKEVRVFFFFILHNFFLRLLMCSNSISNGTRSANKLMGIFVTVSNKLSFLDRDYKPFHADNYGHLINFIAHYHRKIINKKNKYNSYYVKNFSEKWNAFSYQVKRSWLKIVSLSAIIANKRHKYCEDLNWKKNFQVF